MTDAILITLLVSFVVVLAIGNYCQYLKGKIKDGRSVNSEFEIDEDDRPFDPLDAFQPPHCYPPEFFDAKTKEEEEAIEREFWKRVEENRQQN